MRSNVSGTENSIANPRVRRAITSGLTIELEQGVEQRTRRACVESMTVVPRGGATGVFDVYSGTNAEPYVVELGESDRCDCPDVEHNLRDGERCKHARRVRLEFGLAPFGDVPPVRSKHAALTDVELARRRRGIDQVVEPEPEPEPELSIEEQAARAVATDGGRSHAAECANPECEGFDAPGRPLLSADCWEVWASP